MASAGWIIFGMALAALSMWGAGWQRRPTPAEIEAGIARIEAASDLISRDCLHAD